MDQIRLLSLNVPRHLLETVNILLKGTSEEVQDLLPIQLHAIERVADQGLLLATSVEAKFNDVMSLTAEILESCVGARGKYETDLRETEIALQIARENKKIAEERKGISRKAYDELAKAVKDAEKSYYEAMDSMPSGWKIIEMNVVEGIGDAFTTFLSGVSRVTTLGMGSQGSTKRISAAVPGRQSGQDGVGVSLADGTVKAYKKAILLKTHTNTLLEASIQDGKLKTNLRQNEDKVIYVEKQYSSILRACSESKNTVSDRVADLCKKGLRVCGDIRNFIKHFNAKEEIAQNLVERILSLYDAAVSLEVEGKSLLWSNPTETRAPNQRVMAAAQDTDGTAAQQHIRNARFKIQQSSAQLEFVREKYDKACDKLQESSQRLGVVMAEIARLDLHKIDFEKIRQTLVKGIKALAELREQWGKIVMFFQMISNLIKCSLNTSLEDFTSTIRKSQEHALQGYPVSALKKDMIYQQAFQAAKLAHVVNMISESYVTISSNHLMDRLAGLGKLLGFDPEKNAAEIRVERENLHRNCAQAQNEIRSLLMKHRREFDHKVETRIRQIKTELENVLPNNMSTNSLEQRNRSAIESGIQHVRETEDQTETKGLDPEDFV